MIPGLSDTDLWSARYEASKVAEGKDADQAAVDTLRSIEIGSGAKLTPPVEQLIRNAVADKMILPILPMAWAPFIRQFARRADGLLLRFAEELPAIFGSRGVTRESLREICADILSRVYPKVADSITDWQTSVLIAQALQLGLLEPSTEQLGSQDSIIRYLRNPSYDIGPIAVVVGPLVGEFRRRKQSILAM